MKKDLLAEVVVDKFVPFDRQRFRSANCHLDTIVDDAADDGEVLRRIALHGPADVVAEAPPPPLEAPEERVLDGQCPRTTLANTSDAEMAAKVDEAKVQLAKYRAVPSLARGTTLHQIVYVFRGAALHTLEEIVCEQMP